MTEIVIDTSAFVKPLLGECGAERVIQLEARHQLLAPDLLLVETAHVLWKQVRWNGMPVDMAMSRLAEAERHDVELVPVSELLPETLALACELPHPVYDTLFLLLALHGGRPLATADAKMREAAEALGVRVEWVGAD